MNVLKIEGNTLYLNDTRLDYVVGYELKSSAADSGKQTTELTVKLLVDPLKVSLNSFSNNINGDFGQSVKEEMAARERRPKQWINESGIYADSITSCPGGWSIKSRHPYGDSLNGETQPQNIMAECGSEM